MTFLRFSHRLTEGKKKLEVDIKVNLCEKYFNTKALSRFTYSIKTFTGAIHSGNFESS